MVPIPWMVAMALQADGWYLRSDIIWSKPNPMPESVRDRPTKAHEYLFLLSKLPRYYFDAEAIKEPAHDWGRRDRTHAKHNGDAFRTAGQPPHRGLDNCDQAESGRNKRTVWTVATQPYSGAHFATFPPKLIEPCILAGTSERGCCPECGAPWERVVEREPMETRPSERVKTRDHDEARTATSGTMTKPPKSTTTGWRPTCDHDHEPAPCIVFDPFVGSGTTVRVANELGRRGVGTDINPAYFGLSKERTSQPQVRFA